MELQCTERKKNNSTENFLSIMTFIIDNQGSQVTLWSIQYTCEHHQHYLTRGIGAVVIAAHGSSQSEISSSTWLPFLHLHIIVSNEVQSTDSESTDGTELSLDKTPQLQSQHRNRHVTRDVKFAWFRYSNFVWKIRILFKLRLGIWQEFALNMTVCLPYFIQHGFHVTVLNFGARSHFSFIDCMLYNLLCLQSTVTKTTTTMYYLC